LGKVSSNLHWPHKRLSWGLLDPFKNRGYNVAIDVVWAKVKVMCFWVCLIWVSHGSLETWG